MNNAELLQLCREAYQKWWRDLTKKGDPARRASLSMEAFQAGWDAAKSDPALKDWCPECHFRESQGAAEPVASAVPEDIYDGYSVYQALSDRAKARTSAENVSDVLDALAKVLRSCPSLPVAPH